MLPRCFRGRGQVLGGRVEVGRRVACTHVEITGNTRQYGDRADLKYPLVVTGQEEGWQWLCEWQACEMWSLPGAAAVDVSSQEVGTGWAER